jgi:hypothetical protein
MQIHSDVITTEHLFRAARIARVDLVKCEPGGSRTRNHKHNVNLEGESRRAPNNRGRGGKAATWDQWGVFLGYLFDVDPDMVCGSSLKYAAYRDANDFHIKTNGRFRGRSVIGEARTFADIGQGETKDYWPADAHGDHTFKFSGTVGVHQCTKCTAVQRWFHEPVSA